LIILVGLVLLPAAPSPAQQGSNPTLRFVPHADLSILDPYFTGVYITRNYGCMVFDRLFAMGSVELRDISRVQYGNAFVVADSSWSGARAGRASRLPAHDLI
jgi:hypothetical protein